MIIQINHCQKSFTRIKVDLSQIKVELLHKQKNILVINRAKKQKVINK